MHNDHGPGAAAAPADFALTREDVLRLGRLAALAGRAYRVARTACRTGPPQVPHSANEQKQAERRRRRAQASAAENGIDLPALIRWQVAFDGACAEAEQALATVRALLDAG
jgi:hypothetical protein